MVLTSLWSSRLTDPASSADRAATTSRIRMMVCHLCLHVSSALASNAFLVIFPNSGEIAFLSPWQDLTKPRSDGFKSPRRMAVTPADSLWFLILLLLDSKPHQDHIFSHAFLSINFLRSSSSQSSLPLPVIPRVVFHGVSICHQLVAEVVG